MTTNGRVRLNVGATAIPIDAVTMDEAVAAVVSMNEPGWRYVVTPNLNHLRRVKDDPRAAVVYEDAFLSLPDGWPVGWLASRVTGRSVDRVCGSDLFARILALPGRGKPLGLVGGQAGPGLTALMARAESNGWKPFQEPALRPEIEDPARRRALLGRLVSRGDGGIVVLGVGAPRDEDLARSIAGMAGRGLVLCLGMSINFSSGLAKRAPRAVQSLKLEWAHRALQEPGRLVPRYLRDARVLLPLAAQNRRVTRSF